MGGFTDRAGLERPSTPQTVRDRLLESVAIFLASTPNTYECTPVIPSCQREVLHDLRLVCTKCRHPMPSYVPWLAAGHKGVDSERFFTDAYQEGVRTCSESDSTIVTQPSKQSFIITPAMQAAIGKAGERKSATVESGAIVRFAEAIGDDNPAYPDIAPPTFLRSMGRATPELPDPETVPRVLDGSSEWQYGPPVKPGDAIELTTVLASLREREGRMGPMLIAEYVTTYVNQRGETVATQRSTVIRMRESS